nr:ABC transporter ATP-binding protein [Paenibacillus phyllosphaerae]
MDIEEIDLVNLSFSYPGANVDTLKNINLKIKKGEKIAILGGNGSGKSTLVNCLLGLYHPTKGSIYINGELLTSENLPSYRTAISAVFQDYYRYKLSIRQNVAVGDLSKENNEDLIELLLSGVGLFEEVKKMKKGINSLLGKEFTNGFELSGGQWQRLAIARGLINDSKLLIIDEPTSALDPLAEMEIMTRFFELNEDKTTVLITHRLGPVKYADRIIVLDSGVIVEEGNHEQLLMLNGLYSAMYLAQSQWYKEHDSLQSAINF